MGKALEKHLDAVQRWVWIPFVPQLLLSLLHREAPHAKALLLRLAQGHPQAMYCPLRTFLLERREAATRVTQTARQLAAKAQESGAAAPSLTTLDGVVCLRAALSNHRTREEDLVMLVEEARRIGGELAAGRF